jgi:hypothetical protein
MDAPVVAPSDEEVPDEERRGWVCATCRERVADPDAALSVGGTPPVCRFPNPAGFVWEIVTVSAATALVPVSAPETAFSWFAGYAWTIVACASCRTHLGWRYDAVAAVSPGRFWGLILARLKLQ